MKVNATTTANVCRSRAEKWTLLERSARKKPVTSLAMVCKTDPSSKKDVFLVG
jgi:hypothetical protein